MTSNPNAPQRDTIFIRNLSAHTIVGLDAWGQQNIPQPVVLSVKITHDVTNSAAKDDVNWTLNYGQICRSIAKDAVKFSPFRGLYDIGGAVSDGILDSLLCVPSVEGQEEVDVLLPKGVLGAVGGVRYRKTVYWWVNDDNSRRLKEPQGSLAVEGCQCTCVIGVNAAERLQKQRVTFDWSAEGKAVSKALEVYRDATRVVIEVCRRKMAMTKGQTNILQRIEGSTYQTVEALATMVARILTMDFDIDSCTVSVMKPSALASVSSVDGAGVEITRTRAFFATSQFWGTDSNNR